MDVRDLSARKIIAPSQLSLDSSTSNGPEGTHLSQGIVRNQEADDEGGSGTSGLSITLPLPQCGHVAMRVGIRVESIAQTKKAFRHDL